MAGLAAALRDRVAAAYAADDQVTNYREQARSARLKTWETAVAARTLHGGNVRRILAVGCGAGREVFALEAEGFEAEGIDITPALLATAREEAARRGSRARFHQGDGETLPFADGVFDAVVMWAQVLGHVPLAAGRAALLAEVRRVLRPGGALSLSCHDHDLTRPLLTGDRIVTEDDPEPRDFLFRDGGSGAVTYMHYFLEPELRALVEDARFAVDALVHTDDLGQAWGNVFVLMARAV